MKAIEIRETFNCDFRSPFILAATEKNSKDVEKLLLKRALSIKDEKIKNLEKRIEVLEDSLREAETKALPKEAKSEIVIVNNYFNFNWNCFALLLLFGVAKMFR